MIRALIIDDEKNARDVLRMQLTQYCPGVEIAGLAAGGEEGIAMIRHLRPDLVFLDIEMPKVNGFDVLQATSPLAYQVIFTTAYDQFAVRAFKYSALDYLLKPIDIEELRSAVDRVHPKAPADLESRIEKLYQALQNQQPMKDRISIASGEGFEIVRHSDIVRCESDSNYTDVILSGGRRIKLTKTLKDVEETLPPKTFYRIHHSHLINIDHISRFFKTDGGYVVMSDGHQINISRQRKDAFFELMR
jgi:two-component system LytT family response regulator